MSQPQRPSGRYRFQGERRLDPEQGVHPEMTEGAIARPEGRDDAAGSVPVSPTELIAMQQQTSARPEKGGRPESAKVRQVLELLETLDTSAWEDQQIALAIVHHLERYHDEVVAEMVNNGEGDHAQLACWAIDADRLMHSRRLLESIDLA